MSLVSFDSIAPVGMIPEDSGGPYVIAAYLVFLVLIAVYVAIMAQRLSRISKQAAELEQRIARVQGAGAGAVQGDTAGPAATAGAGVGDGPQKAGS